MCGRYTLKTPVERLAEKFQFPQVEPLKPRYNIAPSQQVAAVRVLPGEERRSLAMLRWGLIPKWMKDPPSATQPINAKSETVTVKPMFRDAFKHRRCLILADGFYEWKQEGGRKQPVYISMKDGEAFAFAGLWEHWEGKEGQVIETCTLLTTEPNDLVAPIHNRMPVILDESYYDLWLNPIVLEDMRLSLILAPFPADKMTTYLVGPLVNNPRFDDRLCIEPLSE